MATTPERVLDTYIPGARNFRDVGGYRTPHGRVRWRRLYRAAALDFISLDGWALLVQDYGLRTIIDLRSEGEAKPPAGLPEAITRYAMPVYRQGDAWTAEQISQFNRDIADGSFNWAADYGQMILKGAPAFKQLMETITSGDALPVVVHCAAGRDRTAVAIALILGALGVPDDDIAEDYHLSGTLLQADSVRLAIDARSHEISVEAMARVVATKPETMLRFLAEVRQRHGSMTKALAEIGIGPQTIEALRAGLLE